MAAADTGTGSTGDGDGDGDGEGVGATDIGGEEDGLCRGPDDVVGGKESVGVENVFESDDVGEGGIEESVGEPVSESVGVKGKVKPGEVAGGLEMDPGSETGGGVSNGVENAVSVGLSVADDCAGSLVPGFRKGGPRKGGIVRRGGNDGGEVAIAMPFMMSTA